MLIIKKICLAFGLVLACTGIAAAQSNGAPIGNMFDCGVVSVSIPTADGAGSMRSLPAHAILAADGSDNALLALGKDVYVAGPTPVGSGFGYEIDLALGSFMLHGKGPDLLLLIKDDGDPNHCVLLGGASSPEDSGYISSVGNYSLGGVVRSGAGTQHARVGSLSYGDPVALKSRTGEMMNGYEWFEIEFGEGQTGYMWGGIMCSNALHIVGLYQDCPSDL